MYRLLPRVRVRAARAVLPAATALLTLAAQLAACQRSTAPAIDPSTPRILFVGNSLTAANDLPGLVRAIAGAAGWPVVVESVTGNGLALIDHLTGSTDAARRISDGNWRTVILQQGPTTVGLCRDSLVLWSQMFRALAQPVHAEVALFMPWPSDGGSEVAFDAVRTSYQQAAFATSGIFLPAGEAWRSARRTDPTIAVYGPDQFHPSSVGSYLAALTIFERLSGVDVRTLPAIATTSGSPLSLTEATVRLLQAAAHDANTRFPAHIETPVAQPSPPGTTVPGGRC